MLLFIMPSRCTVYKCSNTSDNGYALFRYPQNEILKFNCITAVGRGQNWSPSSSQKLCEVHFKPSEIEFVAGRKRVKSDSIPSRFCTCPPEDKNKYHINNNSGKIKDWTINYYDHIYNTKDQRKPLTELINNNISNGKISLKRKRGTLFLHQHSCIQKCKPLTIEDLQTIVKSQEVVELIDEMQPMEENENLLGNITEDPQITAKSQEIVTKSLKRNE